MKLIQAGDTPTVWFAPQRSALASTVRLLLKASFVLAVAGAAGYAAGRAGELPAIIVGLIAALAGAALAALMLQAESKRVLIQIRRGYARCADTTLGGVFGRAPWSQRVVFRSRVRLWLARGCTDAKSEAPLEPAELAWIASVMAGGSGAASHPVAAGQRITIEAAAAQSAPAASGGIPVTIRLANRGDCPVSVASLERSRSGPRWQAWLGEESCDLFFGRAARERLIPPGGSAELAARVFPPLLPSRPAELRLRVGCGRDQSNLFTVSAGWHS